jgi:hypothetical protein
MRPAKSAELFRSCTDANFRHSDPGDAAPAHAVARGPPAGSGRESRQRLDRAVGAHLVKLGGIETDNSDFLIKHEPGTLLIAAAPLMLVGLIVGIAISLLQAPTQIQESTPRHGVVR